MTGVTFVASWLTLLVAWAVWLPNHRMGPFPPWLNAVTTACPLLLAACRVVLWAARQTRHPDNDSHQSSGSL